MRYLLVETFGPWIFGFLLLIRFFCIAAGLLFLLLASMIQSWQGAAESLVFLGPAMVLTVLLRRVRRELNN